MVSKNIDVAIVGGGLVGMMSAYFLAESNLKIAVFDKSRLAGESSWAGGGILTPLYPWRYADAINALSFRSQQLYPSLISRLKQDAEMDPEYCNSGMLISATDVDDVGLDWLNSNKVNYRNARCDDYQNLQNNDEYILLPDICQVRNPRLAKTLTLALRRKSVALYADCGVTDINLKSSGVYALNTAQGQFTAEKVIVSAGAWSNKILEPFGLSLSVKPIRGQMLLFKAEPGVLSAIVLAEGKYMIPRQDGHVLVGSTMEDVGFDKNTTLSALDDLMRFVKSRCPLLAKNTMIKHWSGLRPGSPQGIPFIFQHPNETGLFINTGHFRNGVVLAPASAELIRDLVLDRQPVVNPCAYTHNG